MQEEPREWNDDQRERCTAANQPHGRAPTPPARRLARDNNRCANEGANVLTPTLTIRHSSGGCRKTLPLRPCCRTASRRQRLPRSDECANN
jgi:hypothetical protein